MTRDSNYLHKVATKVPEVTLVFWIIKIAATTLGETGGNSVTMTLNWGYLSGTAIFAAALVVLVVLQIVAEQFNPFLYWAAIVASTTFGTTMADFADRSLGIGYTGGSAILLGLVLATLALWRWSLGSISVETVATPKAEAFYWAAITFSQTLGTALGDWMADTTGLGYGGGAVIFGIGLAILTILYFRTDVSRVPVVLDGIYFDQTARSHSGRFPRQAGSRRRLGIQQAYCLRDHCRFHRVMHRAFAAARWPASRTNRRLARNWVRCDLQERRILIS